jgi:hypothetical protein
MPLKDWLLFNKNDKIDLDDPIYDYYTEDDYKNFIRDLSLKILLNELTLIPNIDNLDKKTIKRCRKLSKKGMVIGGSVLLKACGLLDRKTGDIDVLWDIDKAKKENIINDKNIVNSWREYGGDQRYKVKLRWLGEVDIFQKNELEEPLKLYDINWANPINTMDAKFAYNRYKDQADFVKIKEKLGL